VEMKQALLFGATIMAILAVTSPAYSQEGPPPGPPPDGMEPGSPGGAGGLHTQAYTLSGVYTIKAMAETQNHANYQSNKPDVSAVFVTNGGSLRLIAPTLITSGDSSSNDNSSFFGLNAVALATQQSTISIDGGVITSTGRGANGLFAVGKGSSITMTGGVIRATGGGAHGVMATQGGTVTLYNVHIETTNQSAAALATDRGGGTITAIGGEYLTSGFRSPGLYSTGDIRVSNAKVTATGAEAAVIEGSNSISVTDGTLRADKVNGVMIYQSFSGDAEGRHGSFTMQGGSLTSLLGSAFYSTNTTSEIHLKHVKVSTASGSLINAAQDRWGRKGSNGAQVFFTAEEEQLSGNITADAISSIAVSLEKHSTLSGAIHHASLRLDETSEWSVTDDSALTGLTGAKLANGKIINVIGNGHHVTYTIAANPELYGKTYELSHGGQLTPQ